MKQFRTLNGVQFEYNEKHYTHDEISDMVYSRKTFSACYAKPSATKISINQKWYDFYNSFKESYYYGICSHNSSFFSIFFMLEDYNLDGSPADYIIKITPSHNYLTKVI